MCLCKDMVDDYIILCLYVEDILIIDRIGQVYQNMLSFKLDTKDIELEKLILWIKMMRILDSLELSQSHYNDKAFGNFNKNDNQLVIMMSLDI